MTQQPPPGYPPPGYPAYPPQPPKHPQAVTVLVLGILGIVVCGLCGPFAWSMGNRVEREINAAQGRWGGATETTVGKVLGIVSTALLAVSAAPALAQQFEKVERIQREEIPAARFVAIAYGIIWLAIISYVVIVASGLKRANQEIADLKRKLGSK